MNREMVSIAESRVRDILKKNPSLGYVPNIGQEKFLKHLRDEPYPTTLVLGAGNGLGKTALLSVMLVACAYGKELVSDEWFGEVGFLDLLSSRVRGRGTKLSIRLVCHADSMKEGGSVLQAIRDYFPKGRYDLTKNGKSYYSQIMIHGSEFCEAIDVKTFDQDTVAHSGTTVDVQVFDEPPPENIYGEAVGRTRGKDKYGGFMFFFLTPLTLAAWMMDQIVEAADGKEIVVESAPIWDNCKDIVGTRGHLSRESIESQIKKWKRINPWEVKAREEGSFTHLSGAVYKLYNPDVHEVDEFVIPVEWPIYCVIDPHDSKTPAIAWFAQGPHEDYVIAEWPNEPYIKLGTNDKTIGQVCSIIREIERGLGGKVIYRFMDPNKGKFRYNVNNKTVQECYSESGYHFEMSMDDLQVGHNAVAENLYYDRERAIGADNKPRLRVFAKCMNMAQALRKYAIKRNAVAGQSLTAQLDPTYKDFADVARYYCVSKQPYSPVQLVGGSDAVRMARVRVQRW